MLRVCCLLVGPEQFTGQSTTATDKKSQECVGNSCCVLSALQIPHLSNLNSFNSTKNFNSAHDMNKSFKEVLLASQWNQVVPSVVTKTEPKSIRMIPEKPSYLEVAKRQPPPVEPPKVVVFNCPLCLDDGADLVLKCGHVFHQDCVLGQLKAGWAGQRVNFNFMNCAMCRSQIELFEGLQKGKTIDLILEQIEKHRKLKSQAVKVIRAYLKQEEKRGAGEVKNDFDSDDVEASLVVYKCYACSKFYCAGRLDCAAQLDIAQEMLLCSPCLGREYKGICKKHGIESALYKCNMCCSIAIFRCSAYDYYCGPCHDGGSEPRVQCKDNASCPLGIKHPRDQKPFCIGCVECNKSKKF
jgi:hypothetical protein